MSISVCMATFNGERYLKEQLSSILVQLAENDEVIIVDDASTDCTREVIASFADPRIKVFINECNRSHVYSFSRALSLAQNDIVIMSDQDDIWLPDRAILMSRALAQSHSMVLSSNSKFMYEDNAAMEYECQGVQARNSSKYVNNVISIFVGQRRYYGCAMAMKREILKIVLPIPNYVESHDLWIAMAGNIAGSNLHVDEYTLVRRVHGSNASILNRPMRKKLWSRIIFLRSLVDITIRIFFAKSYK